MSCTLLLEKALHAPAGEWGLKTPTTHGVFFEQQHASVLLCTAS